MYRCNRDINFVSDSIRLNQIIFKMNKFQIYINKQETPFDGLRDLLHRANLTRDSYPSTGTNSSFYVLVNKRKKIFQVSNDVFFGVLPPFRFVEDRDKIEDALFTNYKKKLEGWIKPSMDKKIEDYRGKRGISRTAVLHLMCNSFDFNQ